MSHHLVKLVLGAALVLAAGSVLAQSKAPAAEKPGAPGIKELGVENAHAMCIGCHGIPGYKTAFPTTYHVPRIAGPQPRSPVRPASRSWAWKTPTPCASAAMAFRDTRLRFPPPITCPGSPASSRATS